MKKCLLVTNIPTPYRIPLFNEISRQCSERKIGFKVVFGNMGYAQRRWNTGIEDAAFEHVNLGSGAFRQGNGEKTSFTYRGLLKLTKEELPDLIITNAFSVATTKLWAKSLWNRVPYIIWSGAIANDYERLSAGRTWQRRVLIKGAEGFIAYGELAKRYLMSMGAREADICIGINTVDTEFFREKTRVAREKLAGEAGEGRKRLLYVGELSRRKRVDSLVTAAGRVLSVRKNVVLDIVGDGVERGALVQMCQKMNILEQVRFRGFLQKDALPEIFANADCFLFPTGFDIWGLVLVEAMAAGLPCIASIRAGATHDLIQARDTGFAMDFDDAEGIATRIEWVLDNPREAVAMGTRGAQFVKTHANIHKSASGFVQAIERYGSPVGRRKPG